MKLFTRPMVPFVEYGRITYTNCPVNLSLCFSVSKYESTTTNTNEPIYSIRFNRGDADLTWNFATEKHRDDEYARILNIPTGDI